LIDFSGTPISVGDLVKPLDALSWIGVVVSFDIWSAADGYDSTPIVGVVWNKEPGEISPEYPEQLMILS